MLTWIFEKRKIINWLFINSIIYEKRESNFTNFEISKILQYKFKCMQFEKIISRKKILTSMKFLNIEIVWIFEMQFTIDHSICTKDWICTLTNPSDQWKQKCYALKQFFQRFLVRNNKLKDCNSYECNYDDNLSIFRDEYLQCNTFVFELI